MVLQISIDIPVLVSMALIVATVFFLYLMIRRTVLGFREGFDSGKREGKR